MNKILLYLKPYIKTMSYGVTIKFIGTIMDLGLPWVLAYMIDDVIPTGKVNHIVLWGIVMFLLSIIAIIGNIVANRLAAKVARNATKQIRQDLFSKILALSSAQTDRLTMPSLIARVTTDTYNVHNMIGMMQRLGIRAPILLIGGVIVTFTLEPVLTLVLLATLPLITILVFFVSQKGIPLYTQVQKSIDQMVRIVREDITGIRVVKALSKETYEKNRFNHGNQSLVEKDTKAAVTMALTNPMMNLLLNVGLSLVILVGAYRVNAGVAQVGKIVAFTTYFTIILNAMMGITRVFVVYSKATASARRIVEVLDMEEELKVSIAADINNGLKVSIADDINNELKDSYPEELKEAIDRKERQAHIVFDRVSFSYNKKENNLTDISISLGYGESLGIIGSTGSGKTTLINLLMRFYDPDKGCIYIDGRDIKSIDFGELRRKFSVVFQNDVLFSNTIYENINFGRGLEISDVKKGARYAQASEFIEADKEGYDKLVAARGNNLSGGQKQRVLVSRALAAKPDILILDDSSSALDYKTDAKLRNAITENYKDSTLIIVAQRISSIMKLDHILVLEEGQIMGYGTHDELLLTCREYQEIYDSYFGGDKIG